MQEENGGRNRSSITEDTMCMGLFRDAFMQVCDQEVLNINN